MQRVLIIGAERGVDTVEKYLKEEEEVCAVCYRPDVRMDKLAYQFDNLTQICISIQQKCILDIIQYLKESMRMPCRMEEFSQIICLD